MSGNVGAISCEVFVDGTRLADTAASWLAQAPTALDGLTVEWGRDGPASQPDLPSCTLAVGDPDGDAEFLGLLHVGAVLEVNAASTVDTGGAPSDVTGDPGMSTDPTMRAVTSAGLTVVDDPAADAVAPPGHALKVTASGSTSSRGSVWVPVAPFTSTPGGWAAIPQIEPNAGTWRATMQVRGGPIPLGLDYVFTGWADSLTSSARTPIGARQTLTPIAGQYVTAGGDVTAPVSAPAWLGLEIGGIHRPAYTDVDPALTYDDTPAGSYADCDAVWLDEIHVLAPSVTTRRANVFAGRITDLVAKAWGDAVRCEITASDWAADLANQNIGDVPWLSERLDARANRIAGYALDVPAVFVDPRPAALAVSWLDVDNQPLYGLLSDLATSGDAVLWPMAPGELWLEDPATRDSVGTLDLDTDTGLVTITSSRPAGGITLDSCDVLRDDLELAQNVEDVLTRVALTWQDQTLDTEGNMQPTEVTLYADDVAAQADLGVRELSVSTLLINASDGQTIADAVLRRSHAGAWHAGGLVWDTRLPSPLGLDYQLAALTLLDMHERAGLLVTVTDVPAWVPLGPDLSSFLEGGSYRFEAGRWILELGLAPSSVSGASCTYVDLDPGWSYVEFDPAVSYVDLWGVDSAYTREAA